MLALIGFLIALAWLSRPDDENGIDAEIMVSSWATARANGARQPSPAGPNRRNRGLRVRGGPGRP